MGPKSKYRSDWQKCIDCGIVMSSKDVRNHSKQCMHLGEAMKIEGGIAHLSDSALKSNVHLSERQRTLSHGFIADGVFYAKIEAFQSKGSMLKHIPSNKALVLMHPSTMKMCRICFGDQVLIKENEEQTVHTAWSSSLVHPTSLIFPQKHSFKHFSGKKVTVHRFSGPLLRAVQLYVYADIEEEFVYSEGFRKYLSHELYDQFVSVGMKQKCCYYGFLFWIKITKIIDGNNSVFYLDTCSDKEQPTNESIFMNDIDKINFDLLNFSLNQSSENNSVSNYSVDKSFDSENKSNLLRNTDQSVYCSTPVSAVKRQEEANSFDKEHFKSFNEDEKEMFSNFVPDKQFFIVTRETTIMLDNQKQPTSVEKARKVLYCDIGGYTEQLKEIKEIVMLPLQYPEIFTCQGHLPKGVLLFGPPGTGKTMVTKAVSNECHVYVTTINGSEIYDKYYGSTEAKLRDIFQQAVERAPSIVFIDELDVLCPKPEGTTISNQERRVVATLSTIIDGLPNDPGKRVLVLATTNTPDSIDAVLRRPGRIDKEIKFGIPNIVERNEILRKLLEKKKHNLTEEQISSIAEAAHGFTGADLDGMCRQATLLALQRSVKQHCGQDAEMSKMFIITISEMLLSLKEAKPTVMRESSIEVPKIHWSDIGGMQKVKQKLKEVIEWPLKHPEAFHTLGITPSCGVLMYGPPGCSKTMVAKALATESGLNFIPIKGPELFNKWVGESERAVRELFKKARSAAPCIIFFDEIDALAAERGSSTGGSNVGERVLAQLLTEMDGIEQLEGVVVVAATNRPDMIDAALLRPGRLDSIIYVPLPDAATRKEIFQLKLRNMPISQDVDIEHLVETTEGYSGAEIIAVCHEAALQTLGENVMATNPIITWKHFEEAIATVTPRTSKEVIEFYEKYGSKNSFIK